MLTLHPQESDPTASLEAAAAVPLLRTVRGSSVWIWLVAVLFARIPPPLIRALPLHS